MKHPTQHQSTSFTTQRITDLGRSNESKTTPQNDELQENNNAMDDRGHPVLHSRTTEEKLRALRRACLQEKKQRQERNVNRARVRPRRFFRILFSCLVICAISLVVFSFRVIFSSEGVSSLARLPLIRDVTAWTDGISRTYTKPNRITALILGMAGGSNEGGLLTDTILYVSYDPKIDHAVVISIPRDVFVEIPGYDMQKINTANAYGEQNQYPGGGGALAAKVVESIFDEPIDYFVRIDFSGFVRAIDLIGGIDVFVDRAFTDSAYPTKDFLYQTISFDHGWQHLNGETALTYVRSRHGNNGEGSDFARARRQQKVIEAARQKVFDLKLLLNPKKLADLAQELAAHIDTNIKPWQLPDLITLATSLKGTSVTQLVLDDAPQTGLLASRRTENGAFVLVPRTGDWEKIRTLLATAYVEGSRMHEGARIFILNGTHTSGLAQEAAALLKTKKLTVVGFGNAPLQEYEKSVLYVRTDATMKETVRYLKNLYQANVTSRLPADYTTSFDPAMQTAVDQRLVDLILVLGQPQTHTQARQ